MIRKKKKQTRMTMAKVQPHFNRMIRERDSEDGYFTCISCGEVKPTSAMNAGHYVPVKMSNFLRFNEMNVNGECAKCNGFDDLHLIGYRERLIEKIGLENVQWLETNKRTQVKYTQSDLRELYEKYKNA